MKQEKHLKQEKKSVNEREKMDPKKSFFDDLIQQIAHSSFEKCSAVWWLNQRSSSIKIKMSSS